MTVDFFMRAVGVLLLMFVLPFFVHLICLLASYGIASGQFRALREHLQEMRKMRLKDGSVSREAEV